MQIRRLWKLLRARIPGVIVVPLLALASLSAWALASPVGASPDDDFHLVSIWCGLGDRGGLCEPGAKADQATVPQELTASPCYAHDATKSASCQGADFGTHPDVTVSTDRGNFTGLYPPVFYFVNSIFAGENIDIAVILMRVFNALLYVALVTAAYLLLPLRRRTPLLVGAALTIVPLGVFLIPSTNPSSWAIASATVLWITLVGFMETVGRRRVGLAIVAVVATVMGAGARADAAIWSICAVAIALFLTFRRERAYLIHASLPVLLAIVSAAFYLSASQSGAVTNGLTGEPPHGLTWIGLFIYNLTQAPDLWVGVFGHYGLGWLDTPIPNVVWVAGFAIFVGAVALNLRTRDRRTALVMAGITALLFVIPSEILTQSNAVVGGYVQPRYLMPLIIIFGGVAVLFTGRSAFVPRLAIPITAGVMTLTNSLALFVNMRRYITGDDTLGLNLNQRIEWWWPAAPSPMVIWVLGSVLFGLLYASLALYAWNRAAPAASQDPAIVSTTVAQ
ncbi:MAG: DUF2142 domain-containing protein [Acidobacteriota bacterium]